MEGTLAVTGDPAADHLLNTDPLALLVGMLLDQQVPMEWAFMSPYRLQERLGALDAAAIVALGPEKVDEAFRQKPALHRFPGSMAKRTFDLCRHLIEHHGGSAEQVWQDAGSGAELWERVRALPGFGDEKARIFIALLAKRFGVAPEGWEDVVGPFADATPRSVADIGSTELLHEVRRFKQSMKAKGKTKAD